MQMTNRTYDILKKICLMATPVTTFILAATDIFGFTWGAELAALVAAFGAMMGACLEISSRNYYREDEPHE